MDYYLQSNQVRHPGRPIRVIFRPLAPWSVSCTLACLSESFIWLLSHNPLSRTARPALAAGSRAREWQSCVARVSGTACAMRIMRMRGRATHAGTCGGRTRASGRTRPSTSLTLYSLSLSLSTEGDSTGAGRGLPGGRDHLRRAAAGGARPGHARRRYAARVLTAQT